MTLWRGATFCPEANFHASLTSVLSVAYSRAGAAVTIRRRLENLYAVSALQATVIDPRRGFVDSSKPWEKSKWTLIRRARSGQRGRALSVSGRLGNGRERGNQPLGERMLRGKEDCLWSVAFHDLAAIQQGDAMAQGVHRGQ